MTNELPTDGIGLMPLNTRGKTVEEAPNRRYQDGCLLKFALAQKGGSGVARIPSDLQPETPSSVPRAVGSNPKHGWEPKKPGTLSASQKLPGTPSHRKEVPQQARNRRRTGNKKGGARGGFEKCPVREVVGSKRQAHKRPDKSQPW